MILLVFHGKETTICVLLHSDSLTVQAVQHHAGMSSSQSVMLGLTLNEDDCILFFASINK